MKVDRWLLEARQSLPLEIKVRMTQQRIRQWYEHWGGDVYVAFSGGKDSTVLLHITREIYPDVPAVFVNTGLQYPEVRSFALSHENVVELRPAMNFKTVIERYGWPVVSKRVARYVSDLQNASERNRATCNLRLTGMNRKGEYCASMKLSDKWLFLVDAPFKISSYCCEVMKKAPLNKYVRRTGRQPLIGVMVSNSSDRLRAYLKVGCNAFHGKSARSWPMACWTEQDVLQYVLDRNLPIASVYGEIVECDGQLMCTGEHNTGCVFCAFGVQYDGEPNRFQRLKVTHPKLWLYCMDRLGMREVLEFMGVPTGG